MLRIASKLAERSDFRYRLGAVIVKGGCVISTGFNKIRYVKGRIERKNEISLHAEQAAILAIIHRLDALAGSTIYVSRVRSDGSHAMARPCPYCMRLIQSVGIKKMVYTTDYGSKHEKV